MPLPSDDILQSPVPYDLLIGFKPLQDVLQAIIAKLKQHDAAMGATPATKQDFQQQQADIQSLHDENAQLRNSLTLLALQLTNKAGQTTEAAPTVGPAGSLAELVKQQELQRQVVRLVSAWLLHSGRSVVRPQLPASSAAGDTVLLSRHIAKCQWVLQEVLLRLVSLLANGAAAHGADLAGLQRGLGVSHNLIELLLVRLLYPTGLHDAPPPIPRPASFTLGNLTEIGDDPQSLRQLVSTQAALADKLGQLHQQLVGPAAPLPGLIPGDLRPSTVSSPARVLGSLGKSLTACVAELDQLLLVVARQLQPRVAAVLDDYHPAAVIAGDGAATARLLGTSEDSELRALEIGQAEVQLQLLSITTLLAPRRDSAAAAAATEPESPTIDHLRREHTDLREALQLLSSQMAAQDRFQHLQSELHTQRQELDAIADLVGLSSRGGSADGARQGGSEAALRRASVASERGRQPAPAPSPKAKQPSKPSSPSAGATGEAAGETVVQTCARLAADVARLATEVEKQREAGDRLVRSVNQKILHGNLGGKPVAGGGTDQSEALWAKLAEMESELGDASVALGDRLGLIENSLNFLATRVHALGAEDVPHDAPVANETLVIYDDGTGSQRAGVIDAAGKLRDLTGELNGSSVITGEHLNELSKAGWNELPEVTNVSRAVRVRFAVPDEAAGGGGKLKDKVRWPSGGVRFADDTADPSGRLFKEGNQWMLRVRFDGEGEGGSGRVLREGNERWGRHAGDDDEDDEASDGAAPPTIWSSGAAAPGSARKPLQAKGARATKPRPSIHDGDDELSMLGSSTAAGGGDASDLDQKVHRLERVAQQQLSLFADAIDTRNETMHTVNRALETLQTEVAQLQKAVESANRNHAHTQPGAPHLGVPAASPTAEALTQLLGKLHDLPGAASGRGAADAPLVEALREWCQQARSTEVEQRHRADATNAAMTAQLTHLQDQFAVSQKETQRLLNRSQQLRDQVRTLRGGAVPGAGTVPEGELQLVRTTVQNLAGELAWLMEAVRGKVERAEIIDRLDGIDETLRRKVERAELDLLLDNQADRASRVQPQQPPPVTRIQPKPRPPQQAVKTGAPRRANEPEGGSGSGDDLRLAPGLAQQLAQLEGLLKDKADRAAVMQELTVIRDAYTSLEQSKADADLLAQKAEREYVDLMTDNVRRELSRSVNSACGGIMDTLDKSLNILRDMLEGKADAMDVAKIQKNIAEFNVQQVAPDGLAGFKCLSCNKTLEVMKAKPSGFVWDAFTSTTVQTNRKTSALQALKGQSARALPGGWTGMLDKPKDRPKDGAATARLPPLPTLVIAPEDPVGPADAVGELAATA